MRVVARRPRRAGEARNLEMPRSQNPADAIKKAASTLPDVVEGTSCNQTSYKAGKKAFLYVGPGAKGIGFKAMFKLDALLHEAQDLAKSDSDRFIPGVGNWVTTRFSAEQPLPKKLWSRWLKDAYAGVTKSGGARKKSGPRKKA